MNRKKRLPLIMVSVCLALGLVVFSVSAANKPLAEPIVTLPDVEGEVGDIVEVDIDVIGIMGLWGGQVEIKYDPLMITPVDCATGIWSKSNCNLNFSADVIKAAHMFEHEVNAGVLLTLKFELIGEGVSSLEFISASFGLEKIGAGVDGSITVHLSKQDAIDAAIAAIDALPAAGDLTLDHADDLVAAREAVDYAKSRGAADTDITNLSTLVALEALLDDLEAATAAVETAEASEDQGDVDAARTLVEALPDGGAKTALGDRLVAVEAAIAAQAAKEAAIQAAIDAIAALPTEGNLTLGDAADVEAARDLVTAAEALGATSSDITNLSTLEDLEALLVDLQAATDAVAAAEASGAQADVNTARTLVNALPDGGAKTALSGRLDVVEAAIAVERDAAIQDAIAAIDALPAAGDLTLGDAAAVEAARALVTAAEALGATSSDITNLSKLEALEDLLDDLEAATAAVEAAEASGAQADVNTARTLVNALPDGGAKSDLGDRLDAVEAAIAAQAAKEAAIQDAINAINALPTEGDLLLTDAADVEAARDLVTAAEVLGATSSDITNLSTLEDLEALLVDLQAATDAVEAAETSGAQADVNTARTLVNALPNGGAKTALSGRLDAVEAAISKAAAIQAAIDAIAALPAEGNLTLSHSDAIAAARALVTAAEALGATSSDITNLSKLEDLEDLLVKLQAATAAVEAAEASEAQADVTAARLLVNALPNGGAKTALSGRLDVVEAAISKAAAIQAAIDAITALPAEGNLTLSHSDAITAARALVTAAEALGATSSDITNLSKLEDLEDLLVKLQAATAAVVAAETSKDQDDIDNAWVLVNALPDGAAKDDLAQRLYNVQALIDLEAAIAEANNAIDALPDPGSLALGDGDDVKAARMLVEAAKAAGAADSDFGNDRLNKLAALEDELSELQKAAAIAAAEEAIDKLHPADGLTLADLARVSSVRSLVDEVKDEYGATDDDFANLAILEAAEARMVYLAAAALVEVAEGSKSQDDIGAASDAVKALPDGKEKDALQARLDALREKIAEEKEAEEDLVETQGHFPYHLLAFLLIAGGLAVLLSRKPVWTRR